MDSRKFSLPNVVYERLASGKEREFIQKCEHKVSSYLLHTLDSNIEYQEKFIVSSLYLIHFLSHVGFKNSDDINTILDFLDHAAGVLRQQTETSCNEKTANCFYRIAIIFQTATDEFCYKRLYAQKAIGYIKEADEIRKTRALDHEAKIGFLYKKFITDCRTDFIREILSNRLLRYQAKIGSAKQQEKNLLSFLWKPITFFVGEKFERHITTDSEQRVKQARLLLKKNPKDPRANYVLAQHYEAGWGGLNINCSRAEKFYRIAAEQNHAGACYELAYLYAQGNALRKIRKDLALSELKELDTLYYQQEEGSRKCGLLLETIHALKEREFSNQKLKFL
jgi:hypothetical protein